MKPIVVTGAAGFIGSALIAHLNALGASDIVAVADLAADNRYCNLAGASLCDAIDKADFLRRIQADRHLPPLSAIVHLGARTATTETDGGYAMSNNFVYTKALAEWCLLRGVRFIYASSAATYGDGSCGFGDDNEALPKLRPLNKYALSKHVFDLWARASGALDAITGLKYFNVFGPNEYHKGEMRSMALKAFEEIQENGRVRLFQSHRPEFAHGEQTRDFIYVKDAVAVTAWFLEHPEATGVFNVGSGRARSWNDLARGIFAALGQAPAIDYISMPPALRHGYQYSTQANLERLRRAGCKLVPRPLEAALSDYVLNYLWPTRRYLI